MDEKLKNDLMNKISFLFDDKVIVAIQKNVEASRQLGFNFNPIIPQKERNEFTKELRDILEG